MSAAKSIQPLTEEERLKRVRGEIERRIDFDLAQSYVTPAQEDFHVLDRYASYLAFRSAEAYRTTAVALSIVVAGVTIVNVLVAVGIF